MAKLSPREEKIIEVSEFIFAQCSAMGLKCEDSIQKKVFIHHLEAFSERLIDNEPLPTMELDYSEISETARDHASEIAKQLKKKYGYKADQVEQYLLSTYFQLYGGKQA